MEKLTYKQNQREENLGEAVLQVFGAILITGVLYVILNLVLGWN